MQRTHIVIPRVYLYSEYFPSFYAQKPVYLQYLDSKYKITVISRAKYRLAKSKCPSFASFLVCTACFYAKMTNRYICLHTVYNVVFKYPSSVYTEWFYLDSLFVRSKISIKLGLCDKNRLTPNSDDSIHSLATKRCSECFFPSRYAMRQ